MSGIAAGLREPVSQDPEPQVPKLLLSNNRAKAISAKIGVILAHVSGTPSRRARARRDSDRDRRQRQHSNRHHCISSVPSDRPQAILQGHVPPSQSPLRSQATSPGELTAVAMECLRQSSVLAAVEHS
jgi:hypothetical protein